MQAVAELAWVPMRMGTDYRRRVRAIGKSDLIDARAALAEDLPVAVPETDAREIKMLLDHREDLVGEMVRMCCRRRWHLHDIDPDFAAMIPADACAPIPAPSDNSLRARLDRGGNRRMNAAIHRIAITQKRMHPPAQDYLAARRALGNSNTEAVRAWEGRLTRRVFELLRPAGATTVTSSATGKSSAA